MAEAEWETCQKIVVRSKESVEIFPVVSPSISNLKTTKELRKLINSGDAGVTLVKGESCPFHSFSKDGNKLLLFRPSVGLLVFKDVHSLTKETIGDLASTPFHANTKNIHLAYFSPLGNYIITWERPFKTKEAPKPNLKVYKTQTGELLYSWFVKNIPRKLVDDQHCGSNDGSTGEQYTSVQFTHDEAFLFHLVSNELHIYNMKGSVDSKPDYKLRCPDLTAFTLPLSVTETSISSSSKTYDLSTFIPENKNKPACVMFHRLTVVKSQDGTLSFTSQKTSSKSFFQTENCNIKWSPKGDAALVQTQMSVDKTGQSYYGSSSLYLYTASNNEIIQITIPGKGSAGIHDVKWCPNADKPPSFVMISGKMPAMGTLHNGTNGDAIFTFGEAHRNTICWAPHGRFVCLAGFGNLAGGMDFWDKNKGKKIPMYDLRSKGLIENEIRASCAVGYGWSPDSRSFFVSTTSPRMNVDNSIRLFKYNGYGPFDTKNNHVAWDNEKYLPDKLLSVQFIPKSAESYSDRAQSPPPDKMKNYDEISSSMDDADISFVIPSSVSSVSASGKNATSSIKSKSSISVGRYVPPSARGKTMSSGSSLAERMRREREGSTVQAGKVTKPKYAAGAGGGGGVVGMAPTSSSDGAGKSKSALRRERQKLNKQKAEAPAQAEEKATKEKLEQNANAPVDKEKRAKKLRKILKQISALKEKDRSTLNDDQLKKLESENELVKELKDLGLE